MGLMDQLKSINVREKLGGIAEDALNKAMDDVDFSVDKIKADLHHKIDLLVDNLVGQKVEDLKMKIKANYIDQLDGVDDIPDV